MAEEIRTATRARPGPEPLVDLRAEIAPYDSTRRRMLVDNPAEFFGFH